MKGAFTKASCIVFLMLVMPAMAGNQPDRVKIHFPQLSLSADKGHRVEAIELTATCGSFHGVRNIPRDWTVEVASPSGGKSRFKASAGHGATMLWKLEPWDDGIELNIEDRRCFRIDAVVLVDEGGAGSRKVTIRHESLRLVRLSK